MKSLAEKVSTQLPKLDEFAPIFLWAMFEHEDESGSWDIVLSSDGSDKNAAAAIRKISAHLVPNLDRAELDAVSRVVVIPSEEPSVLALASTMNVQGGVIEIRDCNFMGLLIKHGFIFRTQRPPRTRNTPNVIGRSGAAA